ncbi:MAG: glycosyltransferase [Bacteroidetes bacterium]|nr:glycosyltransferase [Bacteroidota bacterium]
MNSGEPVLLSVGIAAYNHGRFIGAAIESVLAQQTDFNFELVIYDDLSTDGTRDILTEFADKYPDRIRLLLSNRNMGPNHAGRTIYSNCKGTYLIWLDGDDCFCHNEKLRKQVHFLENNPEYNGCFHDASVHVCDKPENPELDQFHDEFKTYSQFNKYRHDFYPWDLLERKIIPTASLVFRKNALDGFFNRFGDIRLSLSWVIHLYLIRHSKFRYFNETWSVYNDHIDGVSKKVEYNEFKTSIIDVLERLLSDDYYRYISKDVHRAIARETYQIISNPRTMELPRKEFFSLIKRYKNAVGKQIGNETEYYRNEYKRIRKGDR